MNSDNYKCSYDELVDIHKLVENPKNPNKHTPEQIERLAKIIDYQGQRRPVTVSNRSGFITCGHGRLQAIKQLGWEKVAVDFQDYEDEAQEYADMTADNAIAEWAELDLGQINQDFLDLGPELDLDMLGLKDFVIEPIEKFEPQSDEDELPDVKHDPVTKRGDVWLLGDHRVMCGDSTMIDDVEKLMDGEKADMVFTDPPYGVDYHGSHVGLYRKGDNTDKSISRIRNDKEQDIRNIYDGMMKNIAVSLDGPMYIFCGAGKERDVLNSFYENGFDVISSLIWRKNNGSTALNANYKPVYELFYYLTNGKRKWKGDHSQWTVWDIKRNNKNEYHPTQKPIDLIEKAINNHDALNVLDFFLGSGSTLIACEKTNRKCYGMELDKHYCDVIVERWQKYTGKEAILESTGQKYNEMTQPNTIKGTNDVS